MFTKTRKSKSRSRLHLMEALEDRRLLSASLTFPSTQSIMVFTSVPGSNSPTETLTITDSGDATLNISGVNISNDPSNATQDASLFNVVNAASVPASLSPGQSFTVQLNYKSTAVGRNSAFLNLQSDDPVNPLQKVAIRGIGVTSLNGGTDQPSLARILRAYEIPTIVGEGPNDSNEATDSLYPEPADATTQEVVLQRLVKAGPGPVTIQALASFTAPGAKPFTLGTYTPGNPNDRNELFYTPTNENQSTYVQPIGATTFDPGTAPFGFYWVSNIKDSGKNRIGYSEDQFNTFDTTDTRKFRFFPMKTPTGVIVPNTYVMTATEWQNPGGYDFTNIVAIVSNVMAAPNAPVAPSIGLQSPIVLAGSNTLIFDRIQAPNPDNPTQTENVHDTNVLTVNNTGGTDLIISSYTLTSGWVLVSPPTFPLTIAAGTSTTLTIKFTATKEPSHPYNETQSPSFPNGGGLYSGFLVLHSNDPNNANASIALEGWWQSVSEHDTEPSVQTIMNLMAGYSTAINPTPIPELTESSATPSSPKYYGEEVVSAYWSLADTSKQVSALQVDSFHTQGNVAQFWEFAQGTNSLKSLWTTSSSYGQTFFPLNSATGQPAALSFTPNATNFGFRVDGEWSDDTKNAQNGGGGHHIRFFPVRTAGGNLVPNTYMMFMDYSILPGQNFDFQDNVYLISNIRPASLPAAPTDLYATASTSGALLQWAPSGGSISGYNVYSSLAATSGFTKLTATPISATTYIDASAPAGTTLYYRITAVNSSSAESLGVQSMTTTLGTPVVGLQSVDIGGTPAGSTTEITPQTAYTITAGGPGVTGNVDGFRFVFQQQTGNFDMRVQVSSLTVAGNFSTAGIMARSTLDTNSANVYAGASPVNYRFKYRTTVGGSTTLVVGPATAFPNVWVRLSRVGNVFTAYSGTDGINWTVTSTVTASLPTALYLGLAVASNTSNSTTTAQVNSFGTAVTGPVANADAFTATTAVPSNINVLTNDTDSTGTLVPATVTIGTPPNAGGTATANSDGTITYTSAAGYVGTETFTYTVSDGSATSMPGTVTMTVTAPGPNAIADFYSAITGKSVVVDVLSNDTDATGTILPGTVVISTPTNNGGNVSVDPTTGAITYTPAAGFTGSETFSYTVQDSGGLTSQPAVVTFAVSAAPVGPVANPDSAHSTAGSSVLIDVLANDLDASGVIDPTTVAIVQTPDHGGIVQIDPATGAITYTAAAGFTGTETFSYDVQDNNLAFSQPAIVTVNVIGSSSSVSAGDDTATTVVNTAAIIPVLANDSAAGTLNLSSLTILTKPSHGTATVEANGTVLFAPDTGYVGPDSFTYTVSDTTSNGSNLATVNLNVGVELSSAKGGNKSVTYTDPNGVLATITLNKGVADIFFTGTGAAGTPGKPGAVVVTGMNRTIGSIMLSDTTAGSTLTIKSAAKGGVITLGNISDSAVVGRIIAPTTQLTGTISIGGISVLQLQSAANAQIQIGGGVAAGMTFIAGAVVDSSINSSVAIRSLKVTSWTNAGASSAISAPAIGVLLVAGDFSPVVSLTAGGSAMTLANAKVGGSVGGGWTIAGNAGALNLGAVVSGETFTITGKVNSVTLHGGGMSANLTASSVGNLNITGDLTGDLTIGSARAIKVSGNIIGSTLSFTGPVKGTVALNQLIVAGDINTTSITTVGDILNLAAGSLTSSTINVGSGTATLASATSANIGTNKINSIQLKTKTGNAFSNSSIIADVINSASLGAIKTANGGTVEGLAAVTFKSISMTLNAVPFHAGAAQLADATALSTYLTSKGIAPSTFGDFKIVFV